MKKWSARWLMAGLACGIWSAGAEPLKPESMSLVGGTGAEYAAFSAFADHPGSEWRFGAENGRATVEFAFARGMEVDSVEVETTGGNLSLTGAEVSGDGEHWRPVLGAAANLPAWPGGGRRTVDFAPSAVGSKVRLHFRANPPGYEPGAGIRKITLSGRENRPERHLLCWSGDWERDYRKPMDFFDHELGVTDLWLDFVETAFPQSNNNAGLDSLEASGVLPELRRRSIRYWLGEHEAVTTMVQRPEDWHDDLAWQSVYRAMRRIYPRARSLGFTGIVCDAENYFPLPEDVRHRYEDELKATDHAGSWSFPEEFGYGGMYYRRGLEFGKLFHELWPEGIFMQLYEARFYDGVPGCRDGNYWWLKGIADGGVERIWLATEKTYGAGNGEIGGSSDFLHRWFVDLDAFIPEVYRRYPMVSRVIPGFHPWNTRLQQPMYQARYLAEQFDRAQRLTPACWIYLEGTIEGGDPRAGDLSKWQTDGARVEDYLEVFRRYSTTKNQK